MKLVGRLTHTFFDIRPGEHLRLWAMFLYLLFVLFAYYIIKPVSRAMFLTKFDIDKLPLLYILIAIFGGLLAYLYSKVAAKASLNTAITWAMALSAGALVVMWWLIRLRIPWMVYVLNIWVSLFSIVLVSQGWLVASNLFDERQAKRLYPILDAGMVLGAAFGGEFTREAVALIGTENLLLASAVMVVLAYLASRFATRATRPRLEQARGGNDETTDFSFRQMIGNIAKIRHVRIIVGMMVVMFLVDTLVEYQFQVVARQHYRGDQLTAFFGQFYGLWLNGVEFVFQFFVTTMLVRTFGVGATLQVAPIAVGLSSLAIVGSPGVASASGVRLVEASTRYTLTKTGIELLYMPLPLALRNQVKAFIDIFVDRLSRGIGGVLLIFVTAGSLHMGVRGIVGIVVALSVAWALYSEIARKEYVNAVSRKFTARRLDMASLRVSMSDRGTIHMLETAAQGENARQAIYALTLLSEAPGYGITPMLDLLVQSPIAEMRERAYELAANLRYEGVLPIAVARLDESDPEKQLIRYLLTVSPFREKIGRELLSSDIQEAVGDAVEGLRSDPELARRLISRDWIERLARSADPRWRLVAAEAIGIRGDDGIDTLHHLLKDHELAVRQGALQSAGNLQDVAYLYELLTALGDTRLRGDAIQAIGSYGERIMGSLSDALNDDQTALEVRKRIPRILRNIRTQRSVDTLLPATASPELAIREAALRALNQLRITAPNLKFNDAFVERQLMDEARVSYELNAVLAPFRDLPQEPHPALRLLARTIQCRLDRVLARLFYLLGLRYPPEEIHLAYLAVSAPKHNDTTAALEFLDNVLDHNLKRVLMPLLDAPQNLLDRGESLFGVRKPTLEEAVRMQMKSHEPWLAAVSTAAAQEVGIFALAGGVNHGT